MIFKNVSEILPSVEMRSFYGTYFRQFLFFVGMLGIPVRFAYLRCLLGLSWTRCAFASFMMGATSAIFSLLLLALEAWMLAIFARKHLLPIGEENPVSWISLLLIIAVAGTVSDISVLRFAFRQRLGHKRLWLLNLANFLNIVCAAIATYSYFLRHPPTA
jgi:hypothetical protein